MTTSSGKPSIDEQAIDSSWESQEAAEPEAAALVASAAAGDEDEPAPIYGVGVPYGGNDRTEEIEPIALDMPFSPEDGKLNDWNGGRGIYFQDPDGHVLELMTVPQ